MLKPLYIIWTKENEIGIPIIDEQHRSIVSTINTFHYYISNGIDKNVIFSTLKILEQYTKLHFQTEQELMQLAGYLDLASHLELHKEIITRTEQIVRNVNITNNSDEVLQFLKDWWIGHINKEDRKYVSYVSQLIE